MFSSDFAEKNAEKVVLKGISFEALECIVQFILIGGFDFDQCSLRDAIAAADYLDVQSATKRLLFLSSAENVNVASCLYMANSMQILEPDVQLKVANLFRRHFRRLLRKGWFYIMEGENLVTVLNTANAEPLAHDDAVAIIKAWIEFDLDNREEHVPALLKTVVFTSIPTVR